MPDQTASTSAPASTGGLDPKIAGLLCWIFAPITSLIFMLMEDMKKDEFIQYHAKNSLYFGIANILFPFISIFIAFIPFIGWLISCVVWLLMLGFFGVRIYYAIKAYNGEKPVIPILSSFVK